MFENVRLTAIGLATVLDAVLLIAIVERSNRHRVAAWMWLMIGSTLLFHAGSFVHHLVAEATGTWANDIDWASMVCMSLGLLTLPAAMVHGSVRLCATGLDQSPDPRGRCVQPFRRHPDADSGCERTADDDQS